MSALGHRLRHERESRGLALLQVELDTRIRANIIQSLEEGDFENLPPEPFLRGLIRSYANYLRVNPQELLDLYAADTAPASPPARPQWAQRPLPGPNGSPASPGASDPPGPPHQAPPTESTHGPLPIPGTQPSSTLPWPTSRPESPDQPSTRPARENQSAPPNPQSSPEPIPWIGRRLPLAPPSPKPKNPAIPAARTMAPPSSPPETLPPPESLTLPTLSVQAPAPRAAGPLQRFQLPQFHLSMPPALASLPTPTVILMALALVFGLLACGLYSFTHIGPAVSAIAVNSPSTPTRIAKASTPTIAPGTAPTSVPTIPATAPPFTLVAAIHTPTSQATPKSTADPAVAALALDIEATQVVTAQIGIDGAIVFNGPIAAGELQSWTAQETLYMLVENPVGATIRINGKPVLARVFAERSLIERQWIIGPGGAAVATTPLPPPLQTPTVAPSIITPAPTKTPSPLAPTPTLTPFS